MVKGVNGINQTSTLIVTGTHTREDEGRRMLRMCDVAHVDDFFSGEPGDSARARSELGR